VKMSNIRDGFGIIPSTAQVKPEDFVVEFPKTELDDLRSLIAASRVGPETFEGLQPDRKYGIDARWLQSAKDFWLDEFDW
jgi:microsomal epoxide hydrolase